MSCNLSNRKRISTRLIYDECAYKNKLKQSNESLDYTLYPGKFYNCSKCRMELGQVGGNGVSLYSGNLVDLESDLMGIQRTNPKCDQPFFRFDNADLIPQSSCQMVNYSQTVTPVGQNLDYCGHTKPDSN